MKKRLKRIFSFYNFAIFATITVIVVALILILEPDFSKIIPKRENSVSQTQNKQENNTKDELKIVNSLNKTASEDDARKMAKKQFKELKENVNEKDLQVIKIQREGEEYYYISSPNNTCEVKLSTGEITRVNSVKVENK